VVNLVVLACVVSD